MQKTRVHRHPFHIRVGEQLFLCQNGWSPHGEEARKFRTVQGAVSVGVRIGGYNRVEIIGQDSSPIWISDESDYCDPRTVMRTGRFIIDNNKEMA